MTKILISIEKQCDIEKQNQHFRTKCALTKSHFFSFVIVQEEIVISTQKPLLLISSIIVKNYYYNCLLERPGTCGKSDNLQRETNQWTRAAAADELAA